MNKNCGCGGDCCKTESHPKLRKIIREIVEKQLSEIVVQKPGSPYEVSFWYRNREGDMDNTITQVMARDEKDAYEKALLLHPRIKKDSIEINKK
jgi:hypothetical protein